MNLKDCTVNFLGRYLRDVRGVDPDTILSYKTAFKSFIPFSVQYLSKNLNNIDVSDITVDLILDFLDYLEKVKKNGIKTRNQRLAAIRSMARMILVMAPEHRETAERILTIPVKRSQKSLFGYLTHEEVMKVFESVDLKRKAGFRDYTMLHFLFDSGARGNEVAELRVSAFEPKEKQIGILGKGNGFRIVQLWTRTTDLMVRYLAKFREMPKPEFQNRFFINQRREGFTRHGIYRICDKYLKKVLPENRRKNLDATHCFRHSCAVDMLANGSPISDIKNHLGHQDIKSTMIYLRLDLSRRREVQKKFIDYTETIIKNDPKIDELIDWGNKDDLLDWLDNL